MAESVDVVVIGMGPGGESVAGELVSAGLSVVGIEANLLGGECPYYACVPSKMMIRAANSVAEAHRVSELAGRATVSTDLAPVAHRIRVEATDNWNDQVAVDRFERAGGRFVRGRGQIVAPGVARVGELEFRASRAIVINTGTEPAVPPIPGLAGTPFWTNREAIAAETAPDSLIVLGGGPVGVELAQVFARFGSRVDVVQRADRLLPPEEPESGHLLAEVFAREGIKVHTSAAAERVEHDGTTFVVQIGEQELTAERLLVATGRRTNLDGLGLASIGLDAQSRFVDPDARLRIAEGVYAIGDITGKGAFTHMSMYQARIVTQHILGDLDVAAEYHAVPRVTFTDPEIGSVGMTETQARDRGVAVATAVSQIPSSTRGWIHSAGNDGFIKLVADTDHGILVGATSAGPHGGEVLSMLTLAVHERTPISRLKKMIYAYPTFHRAIDDALSRLP
jgi:pyruvate/2-oxoglutarate dehydrogenase complex dihydrolipoamide dehydrogenase (E3) component